MATRQKSIAALLILFLVFAVPAIAEDSPESHGIRWDRMLHAQWGIGISASWIVWGEKYLNIDRDYLWIYGIVLATAIGYGKEVIDNRGNFDVRYWSQDSRWDVASFTIGGFVGFCWTRTF